MAESLHAGNIRVLLACDAEYPASRRDDFAAPAVWFARGNLAAFANRRVGIIGTRANNTAGAAKSSRSEAGYSASLANNTRMLPACSDSAIWSSSCEVAARRTA
ncbi:MAG: DNA-processing protein DprA [Actinomycetota bacterium]